MFPISLRTLALLGLAATLAVAQEGFAGPGRYEIVNVKTGNAMELNASDLSTVFQSSPRGSERQRWEIAASMDGYFYFRNATTGRVLQVKTDKNDSPVVCAQFDGDRDQQWKIDTTKDGNVTFTSRLSGKTLEFGAGAIVKVSDAKGSSANQQFTLHRLGK